MAPSGIIVFDIVVVIAVSPISMVTFFGLQEGDHRSVSIYLINISFCLDVHHEQIQRPFSSFRLSDSMTF